MDNSTAKFGGSSNSTTLSFGKISSLEICVYTFGFLFGLPTHSYVIYLIMTGTKSGIASEFFIFNLSVCEIGVSLDVFLFILSISFSWLFKLAMFLQGLIVTGRPLFQSLICVERYLAVVHPVTFLKCKPLRYRLMCCAVAWIICLGSCLCCILLVVLFPTEIYIHFYSLQFLVLLFIQLFCCVAVLRALKQSGPGERGREREEENHMKRRAFHLILIITVTTFITYMPYIILGIFIILTKEVIYEFWYIGLICYGLAGFVQPVLYLHRAGKLTLLCRLTYAL